MKKNDNSIRLVISFLSSILAAVAFSWPVVCDVPRECSNTIVVVLRAPEGQAKTLFETISAHVSDLPICLVLASEVALPSTLPQQTELARELAKPEGISAVVWLDAVSSTRLFAYIAAPGSDRVLAREIAAERTALRHSEAAIIVRSFANGILSGAKPGFAKPESTPSSAKTRPEKGVENASASSASPLESDTGTEARAAWRVLNAVDSALIFQGSEPPASLAAGLSAAFIWKERWVMGVGYAFVTPIRRKTQWATLELRRHPVTVSAGIAHELKRSLWSMRLAVVVDAISATVRDVPAGLVARGTNTQIAVGVGPLGELQFLFSERFGLRLKVLVEVETREFLYEAQVEDGNKTLFETWPVRPWIGLGLIFASH